MSELPQIYVKKFIDISKGFSGRRVCVSALPGIGMTGKSAVDHLISQLKPEKFAEVYSTDFPSHILISETGEIITPSVNIYYLKHINNGDLELFLITGDTQPNTVIGTNALSDHIVKLLVNSGVDIVIALAATPVISPKRNPKVYLTFSSDSLFQEFLDAGVKNKFVKGTITGMNGVMPGIAKAYNIGGVVLLSETYPQFVRDINASVSLIKVLNNYLSLNVDTSALEQQASKTFALYDKMRKRQKAQRQRKGTRDLGYIS
ncbi:MAG: PAC2 family protein [Candidatus Helarchaeota archaeon]